VLSIDLKKKKKNNAHLSYAILGEAYGSGLASALIVL